MRTAIARFSRWDTIGILAIYAMTAASAVLILAALPGCWKPTFNVRVEMFPDADAAVKVGGAQPSTVLEVE